MQIDKRILVIIILYISKFIFGFWLYFKGKPYNGAILTVHKLTSLATLVYIVVIASRIHSNVGLNTGEIISVIVTCVLFLAAITSGSVLSFDKPAPVVISIIHKVSPFLSVIATAVTLYLIILSK